MPKKIAIFGATGLIGKKLSRVLIDRGDNVIVFSRSIDKGKKIIPRAFDYVSWTPEGENWQGSINKVDAVINLAGENVMARRWNEEHKRNIRDSRVNGTRAIADAIVKADNKPEVLVNSSATGYYGNSSTKEFDENSDPGNDFLAEVTKDWEHEAKRVEEFGVRYVGIRTGIVLDKNEGALSRMLLPFKYFIGGPLGDGKQWFPWIHVDDVVGMFVHSLDNVDVEGPLNAAAPQQVTMKEFCKVLGKVMRRPSSFNVPAFALKILFGEGAGVLLNGARVKPARTIETGYKFIYEDLEEAIHNVLKKSPVGVTGLD